MSEMIDLTPTEDLLLEVLVARARLGEPFWTFEYRQRPTLRKLEAKGLIRTEAAVTPHTEAYLTPLARDLFMSQRYNPPGGTVEWAVQTADDSRPVHYTIRSPGQRGSEEYHRKYAARHDGTLYRRVNVIGEWEIVVEADNG